jgi:hypothetical protein
MRFAADLCPCGLVAPKAKLARSLMAAGLFRLPRLGIARPLGAGLKKTELFRRRIDFDFAW